MSNGSIESVLRHADPANIDSVDDARSWAIEHDARIDSLWVQQVNTNIEVRNEQKVLTSRLNKLELRIVWFAAIAAGAGSALPQIFQFLF